MGKARNSFLKSAGPTRLLALLFALALVTFPGCRGCEGDHAAPPDPKKKDAKQADAPKKPFDNPKFTIYPATDPRDPRLSVKLGHWSTGALETKANFADFVGSLETGLQDINMQPIHLDHAPYELVTTRPASLAKGQAKNLEMTFFVPAGRTKSLLSTHLRQRGGGPEAIDSAPVLDHMPSFEYYFVALCNQGNAYNYLSALDSTRPPSGEFGLGARPIDYYRVSCPPLDKGAPFSEDPLAWSGIAYILWDDIDPKTLSPEQQKAMLDWLHWGGQLILSGPGTLDLLANSFLAPYLPATGASKATLGRDALAELDTSWGLPDADGSIQTLPAPKGLSGVELTCRPGGEFVGGCGKLVAEGSVGRGRIVVTAFRLSERALLRWRSFDNFFNACLLRRGPREFFTRDQASLSVRWTEADLNWLDSFPVTNVRYFSRDEGREPTYPGAYGTTVGGDLEGYNKLFSMEEVNMLLDDASRQTGVAGWNDFGMVSRAARHALREAAGIVVPKPQFVLRVLGIYLFVLLPVNWIVFRLIGRVEWAWAAVPVIALAGALIVVRQAQIDIGFASSQTEVDTLELQPGYSQAHLTRYLALYTSLSKTYDVALADRTGVALPLGDDGRSFELVSPYLRLRQTGAVRQTVEAPEQQATLQDRGAVSLRRDENVVLSDFGVPSNATGMLHVEQMVDLHGGLSAKSADDDSLRIDNHTQLNLIDATLVRKTPEGLVTKTRIGDLAAGRSAQAAAAATPDKPETPTENESADTALVNIDLLRKATEMGESMRPGDARLVARLQEPLPGIEVHPAPSQARATTLVVANLLYGPAGEPRSDKNLRHSVHLIPLDNGELLEPSPEEMPLEDSN